MKIIITSATEFETEETKKKIKSTKKLDISFSVTGIGMLATAVNLSKIIYEQKPDLIIQAGIAGCFNKDIELGKVVLIEKEFLGDLGVEENNKWIDVFDLKLIALNEKPFTKKAIINKQAKQYNLLDLSIVNAITINQITTQPQHINQLIKKYKPTVESMEGAALHYVGNSFNIPYLQIRSISNYIGERDKTKWKLKLAIDNLNKEIKTYIKHLNR